MLNKIAALAMFAMMVATGSALAQAPPDSMHPHPHPPRPDSLHHRPDTLRPPADSLPCPRVGRQAMQLGAQIERMSSACTDTGAVRLFADARTHLGTCRTDIAANNCEGARTELQAATRSVNAARRLCHGTGGTGGGGAHRPVDPGAVKGHGSN